MLLAAHAPALWVTGVPRDRRPRGDHACPRCPLRCEEAKDCRTLSPRHVLGKRPPGAGLVSWRRTSDPGVGAHSGAVGQQPPAWGDSSSKTGVFTAKRGHQLLWWGHRGTLHFRVTLQGWRGDRQVLQAETPARGGALVGRPPPRRPAEGGSSTEATETAQPHVKGLGLDLQRRESGSSGSHAKGPWSRVLRWRSGGAVWPRLGMIGCHAGAAVLLLAPRGGGQRGGQMAYHVQDGPLGSKARAPNVNGAKTAW